MKSTKILVGAVAMIAASSVAQAANYFAEDFSTYAAGNLVGQNGWAQLGASTTVPLQVTAGQVVIPGGAIVDNQDAYKSLGTTAIPAPASGTTSVFFALQLNVASAGTSPSYFAALYTSNDGTTTGQFANERLVAKDLGGGQFAFGGRVTGQAGYPFVYGSALNYGQTYVLVAEADMVSGTGANDTLKLFVNPSSTDLASQTPYAISSFTSGTGTDPTQLGSLVISQFGSATVNQSGLTIDKALAGDSFGTVVSAVPEPAALGMLGIATAALATRRRQARA